MSGKKNRRVEKLETGLTPKQAIMMSLQEAHAFKSIEDYVRHLKKQPDSAAPLHKLPDQLAEGVKQTLKGKPRGEIDRPCARPTRTSSFSSSSTSRSTAKLSRRNVTTGVRRCCLRTCLGHCCENKL